MINGSGTLERLERLSKSVYQALIVISVYVHAVIVISTL